LMEPKTTKPNPEPGHDRNHQPEPNANANADRLSVRSVATASSTNSHNSKVSNRSLARVISMVHNYSYIGKSEVSNEQEKTAGAVVSSNSTAWKAVLDWRASVITTIAVPLIIVTLWTLLWTLIYTYTNAKTWASPPSVISVLGFVVSLLIALRTNSAYDRYWEARKLWGSIMTHSRNLSRSLRVSVNVKDSPVYEQQRKGAMNLVLAFAISMQHRLRGEHGYKSNDLAHWLIHIPSFHPKPSEEGGPANSQQHRYEDDESTNVSLEIALHLTEYVRAAKVLDLIDLQTQTMMNVATNGLMECLTQCERIRSTPLPLAYGIHIKHVLMIYLLLLPFQIVNTSG
jgi:ion channel-forming bestrophin family protein